MDIHTAFDAILALSGILLGWVLNSIRDSIREMRNETHTLATKVQAIELLVAGQYVTKSDMEKDMNIIFGKLDRIEGKLDGKADK